jgi:cytidyltransferase-like protein
MYSTILHLYNPHWTNCYVTQFLHALSNYVFIVHNNDTNEKVIIRKYILQPRISPSIISHIGSLGFGPKLLFHCEEGTVEEFIDGRKMTHAEMISDDYSKQIACQLKNLHQAGYTHLDLHHNNMLIDNTNTVRFIDYEYCEDATPDNCILDIANHFCEWSYDYDRKDWFVLKPIDNAMQHMIQFVRHYLGTEPSAQYILDIQNAMNISHRRWIDWALVYYETTKNEIYMKYANERAKVNDIIYNIYGKTVYVDGTFDLLHTGHITLLKKARASVICKKLIVGVMSDAAVTSYKRVPIQNAIERGAILKEIKIVDEVVVDAPFEDEFVSEFLDKHKIDIVIYGGDPKLGTAALGRWQHHYREAIQRNIMKPVEYTVGYSTSDIIARIHNSYNN